jgi:hypothetical protein
MNPENQPKHINPEKCSIYEVRKMNELKGWPFDSLGDPGVTPCDGGGPSGGGFPG